MTKGKRKRKVSQDSGGMPFVAVLAAFGGFLIAYLAAEATMNPHAHLSHWLVAGAGAAMGAGLGYLWYRFRGDIA